MAAQVDRRGSVDVLSIDLPALEAVSGRCSIPATEQERQRKIEETAARLFALVKTRVAAESPLPKPRELPRGIKLGQLSVRVLDTTLEGDVVAPVAKKARVVVKKPVTPKPEVKLEDTKKVYTGRY